MSAIHPCEVPLNTMLRSYKDGPGYADCYVTEVQGAITQEIFIEAFYTSPLFKVERTILKYLASRPATDAEAKQLAAGSATKFSAWRIERQSTSELLLADFTGRTRSWLMATPGTGSVTAPSTFLYFGSAVVPRTSHGATNPSKGWPFHALSGFHRLYSRLLLSAASRRVASAQQNAAWWQKVSMWMPAHRDVDGLDAMTGQASLFKGSVHKPPKTSATD